MVFAPHQPPLPDDRDLLPTNLLLVSPDPVGIYFIYQDDLQFTYRVLRKKPNQNSVIFENFGTGKFVSLCKKQ